MYSIEGKLIYYYSTDEHNSLIFVQSQVKRVFEYRVFQSRYMAPPPDPAGLDEQGRDQPRLRQS